MVVGGGAREHALAWKLRQSPRLGELLVAPGNAGTAQLAHNLDIRANDIDALVQAAKENAVELVVVGPEEPLARGLADRLEALGIAVFGPRAEGARIEASKAWARELCARHGIPHPPFAVFDDWRDAKGYVEALASPPVVKADGLAGGKGSFVCESKEEALQVVQRLMRDEALGPAGRRVVIEERLEGREVSAQAFTDGRRVVPMPMACDYKRLLDGDQGPNTGGMGAYSPAYWLDEATERRINQEVTEATVAALASEGIDYRGVLYPGLMVTRRGPMVLEFNCRFGDPEAQVVLPRLQGDLLEICWAVAQGRLHEARVDWSTHACVGVVMASGGYPDEYRTGFPIYGLGQTEEGVLVFHAGTRLADDGRTVLTAGGRVLTVVAIAPTIAEARAQAYRAVQHIHFSRCHYRKDIAAPAQGAITGEVWDG
jgi:phosphoribosylamine--glycine ligase